MTVADPNELTGSCISCRPEKCFNKRLVVTGKMLNMPDVIVSKSDWWQFVKACRATFKKQVWNAYGSLAHYQVCRRSIVNERAILLWKLFNDTGGSLHVRSPQEFAAVPSVWWDVVNIITDELSRRKTDG